MISTSIVIQVILGFTVGIFSGLLGVGGGVLMIPALLYVYPLFVAPADPLLGALTMKTATGVAAIAALGGSCSASITHYLNKNAHLRLMLFVAVGTMTGSYLGSLTSGLYSNFALKLIYAGLLLFIIIRYFTQKDETPENPANSEFILVIDLKNKALIAKIWGFALVIGYFSGLIGIGGAVMLIPLMVNFLNVPVRLAIGSTSGIVFLSAITMALGKWQAGLIPLPWALVIAFSAVPGGIVGAMASKRLSERFLHGLLMLLIGLTLLRVGWELVSGKVSG